MNLSSRSVTSIRRLLLGTAVLLTVAAAVYVEEDWRGEHAWRRVEAEFAARGEPLRIDALTGTPPADNQNLFKAPVWADLVSDRTPPPVYQRALASIGLDRLEHIVASAGNPIDLTEAKRQMIKARLLASGEQRPAAEAVLSGLEVAAPLLDSLRTAARERPLGSPGQISLPLSLSELRLGTIYSVGRLLGFRAQAELAAGRSSDAYEDTYAQLRIARACLFDQANLMTVLVALALTGKAEATISTAIASHAWSTDQIAALQTALEDLQFNNAFSRAIRAERAWGIAYLDSLRDLPSDDRRQLSLAGWMPPGTIAHAKVVLCTMSARGLDAWRCIGTPPFASRLAEFIAAEKKLKSSASLTCELYPAIGTMLRNAALEIDSSDAAATALALERYYLAHRTYPATLAELAAANLGARTILSDGSPIGYSIHGTGFELLLTPTRNGTPRSWRPAAASSDQTGRSAG